MNDSNAVVRIPRLMYAPAALRPLPDTNLLTASTLFVPERPYQPPCATPLRPFPPPSPLQPPPTPLLGAREASWSAARRASCDTHGASSGKVGAVCDTVVAFRDKAAPQRGAGGGQRGKGPAARCVCGSLSAPLRAPTPSGRLSPAANASARAAPPARRWPRFAAGPATGAAAATPR